MSLSYFYVYFSHVYRYGIEETIFVEIVFDPDPHDSALILLSWIRIRIGNADPDQRILPKLTIKSDSHPFKMAFLPT